MELEQQYNDLSEKYFISAREYFMILKLAIFHVDGELLEASYQVSQYSKSEEIYKVACRILEAMYKEK